MIKVFVADDHPVVRDGRLATLDQDDSYVVDPPVLARSEVGVASGPFMVMPLADFTGTITPSADGSSRRQASKGDRLVGRWLLPRDRPRLQERGI